MKRKIFVFLLAIIITGCMLYDLDALLALRIENTGSKEGNKGSEEGDDANIVYDCLVDGHVFANSTIIEATCMVAGSETKKCIVCDYIENKTIPINDNHALSTNPNFSKGVKLTSCTNGCGKINNYTFDYKIGDTVNDGTGGIVYYVADGKDGRPLGFTLYDTTNDAGTKAYFLAAAPVDLGTWAWAVQNPVKNVNGTESAIGTGKRNTRILFLSEESDAAANKTYYYQINNEGFGSWFLPSREELNQLYLNRNAALINLSFAYDLLYWSSTQYNPEQGVALKPDGTFSNNNKVISFHVRPIRAF